ncbi:BglG family transcription antiterminator [Paenibacillus thailandensis]|uniref:BglG family transcription antiterminator n=2 Tax=Paenibacillus thailandensis TaxID=393250 RepID=A0ABW5R2D2_9BACL
MSSRARQILELLLQSERALTAAEIATAIGVSSRTVHRELDAVSELLEAQEIRLIKKSGTGIRLEGTDVKLEELRGKVFVSEDIEFTPDERQLYTLCLLLESEEPVKLFTLAINVKVTVPTVAGDLDELAGWVRRFGLSLIRKRGYGVELSGPEERLREAIRQLIKLRLDDDQLTVSRFEQPLHRLDRKLFEMAGKAEMADVETALWTWEEHWAGRLSEQSYTDLLIRLSIAVRRIKSGKRIGEGTEPEDAPSAQWDAALRLTEQLSERTGVPFNPGEAGYIMRLLEKRLLEDEAILPSDDLALAEAVRSLIGQVEQALGTELGEDRSLRDGLFSHLKISLQRLRDNQRIRNPLLAQIRKDYGSLFRVVRDAADSAFAGLQVPDEEIGFLVMHFGASLERMKQQIRHVRAILVCTSGIGSSKLLQIRLQKEMPQVEIVDRASWYEASRIPKDSYDLIISTIDLPIDPAQYIKVSPLLMPADTERLRSFIRDGMPSRRQRLRADGKGEGTNEYNKLLSLKVSLNEILRIAEQFKVVKLRGEADGLPAVLGQACRHEEEAGVLDGGFLLVRDLLIERERHGSQIIPDTDLALFHTRSENVVRPSLTLYRLETPVVMGTDPPTRLSQFLLMLAPRKLGKEALEVLSEISAMLLDPKMIDTLENGDEKAIQNLLIHHLKIFFRTKMESEWTTNGNSIQR